MKVLLNENGYYTGSYVKVGDIKNGMVVYSLPEEYSVEQQKFCKPKNDIEEVVNKIPVYGYVKEIDCETRKFVTYIEKNIEAEDEEIVEETEVEKSEILEENTEETTTKTIYVPAIIDENGEYIEIPAENIIFIAVDPTTNEIVEGVEVSSMMDRPIIRYDEVVEYKNITIWTFDEEAYNVYLAELKANPPVQELTDKEKIAALEKENQELKESIEVQKEINDNQDLMLLELLEQI